VYLCVQPARRLALFAVDLVFSLFWYFCDLFLESKLLVELRVVLMVSMIRSYFVALIAVTTLASAYQPSHKPQPPPDGLVLDQQAASDTAAQITLQQLPPSSISIEIGDLPVIGNLLSGTYIKVPDGSIAKPSLVIKSPKDKVKAIQSIAIGGHLEFDVGGKISTHLDVDVAADESGTAKVVVQSNLSPKLCIGKKLVAVLV